GVVAAVGRTGRAHPLLGTASNAISVGISTGRADRPLIVAPAPSPSVATAWVSGAAALLLEVAAGLDDAADASRIETTRAVLLAGARKREPEFESESGRTRTSSEPLSPRYGAGELNIDRSHFILEAGRHPANDRTTVPLAGWDVATADPD